MKRRNPKFGCVRIAQQINYAFGIKIDKDVVRRVLKRPFATGTFQMSSSNIRLCSKTQLSAA
jgi:hypothetical protein